MRRIICGSARKPGLVVSEKPLDAYEPAERLRFVTRVGDVPLTRARMRRNCLVAAPDGWLWVGTQDGIVRYRFDGARTAAADDRTGGHAGAGDAGPARRNVLASRFNGEIVCARARERARVGARRVAGNARSSEASDGSLWGGSVERLGLAARERHGARGQSRARASASWRSWPTRDGRHVWAASLGTGAVRIDRRRSGAAPARHARQRPARRNALDDSRRPRRQPLVRAERRRVAAAQRLRRVRRVDRRAPIAGACPIRARSRSLPEWRGADVGRHRRRPRGDDRATRRRRSRVDDGLHSNQIYSLARDAAGRLWIGTVGGRELPVAPRQRPPPPIGADVRARR